jgi:hypothetical protein
MRKIIKTSLLLTAVTLTAVAAPRAARAQAATVVDHPGFDLGLRLGYAIPFGDIDGTSGLAAQFSGGIPFVLEGGYRFNRAFTLGALFQYAVLSVKDNGTGCGNGVSCSGSVVRFGIEGIYHIPIASPQTTPWIGAATGYEWMNVDASAGGVTASQGANGFEFLTLQGGADFRIAPQFGLGPFASLSFARYSSVTGGGVSADITDPAVHEWLQIGVRGNFNL